MARTSMMDKLRFMAGGAEQDDFSKGIYIDTNRTDTKNTAPPLSRGQSGGGVFLFVSVCVVSVSVCSNPYPPSELMR